MPESTSGPGTDFIRSLIARDLETGKYGRRVVTRFPPEPNGYLHIGHAKSICLNFGLAEENDGGVCHLRFDDTNPATEDATFVQAIQDDIRWLGFDWGTNLFFASDYFDQLYGYGVELIEKGLAYIDSSTDEEIQTLRGSVTEPGVDSPYRDRSVEENLDLFSRMKACEFPDGAHVLRAKINMAHSNMVMRDPVLVRIRHAHHYRQGDRWCIYPLYDFAHCLSDSIEGVTHSLCTLEFENNREIYDWLLENTSVPAPRPEQTEFARLNLDYTVTSKRMLKALVADGYVTGWDDPRMPTIAAFRRRGVTPDAIRSFCEMVGVAKANSRIDLGKLDFSIRDDLNYTAPRAFAVLDPLRVVLTNYPEDSSEVFEAPAFPPDVGKPGQRALPFGRELFIEADDFREDPPPGFHRLVPDGEVRLKYAYIIRLNEVIKDPDTGEVVELRCTYDPESKGGSAADGRRIRGTIQWVSKDDAVPAEVRLYEPLFTVPHPDEGDDYLDYLNPNAEERKLHALVEPGVKPQSSGARFQFERLGYFYKDPVESSEEGLVFNRTVPLRDGWGGRSNPPADQRIRKSEQADKNKGAESANPQPVRTVPTEPTDPRSLLRDSAHIERFDDLVAAEVDASLAVNLAKDSVLYGLYETAERHYPSGGPSLAKWLVHEVSKGPLNEDTQGGAISAEALAELVRSVDEGRHSHHQGRLVLSALLEHGGTLADAEARAGVEDAPQEEGVQAIVAGLMTEHPGKVEAYRSGQVGLLGFFVGEVMKQTRGKADPKQASAVAKASLEGSEH